jgi:hypothetical protein
MVEAPSQVRDAIAQTRAEMAETIHALGEKVDATRHLAETVSDETDHMVRAAVQATAKAADVGKHALGSASSQLRARTPRSRVLVPMLVAIALALGALTVLRARRRKDDTEDPLDWGPGEK